jgi:hypothetical protein
MRSSQVRPEHREHELVLLLRPVRLAVPLLEQLKVPVLHLGWRGSLVVTFGGGGSCRWLVSKAGRATLKSCEFLICFKKNQVIPLLLHFVSFDALSSYNWIM